MLPLQKLLEPISADAPSGPNLSYDPAFLELQVKLRGKEETQFSAAEEPNWKEILELSLGLAERFKHLQVGVALTLALLQTEGVSGFGDGLKLVLGWLEKAWETLYPQLDPEDNNDPTERVNILQNLSTTTFGDALRICDRLAQAPLCESKTLGRYNLQAIRTGLAPNADPAAGNAGANAVAAAFRDTDPAFLQTRFDAVEGCLADLNAIDSLLNKLIGVGRGPNFEALKKTLTEMRSALAPYVPSAAAAAAATTGSAAKNEFAEKIPAGAFKTSIDSRDDVIRALRAVCEYYQRREPSSPIPFLLQRAERLVNLDFLQIMNDLAPETVAQLKTITGTAEIKSEKS